MGAVVTPHRWTVEESIEAGRRSARARRWLRYVKAAQKAGPCPGLSAVIAERLKRDLPMVFR